MASSTLQNKNGIETDSTSEVCTNLQEAENRNDSNNTETDVVVVLDLQTNGAIQDQLYRNGL